jgi:YVTN family beta-propeller protein
MTRSAIEGDAVRRDRRSPGIWIGSARALSVLLLWLALSAKTSAEGTGYVFVSNEQTNNIAVIDPKQDYQIIKWIETSRRPRGMSFLNGRKQLLVACGYDNVIDVIDVATLAVTDHIPTSADPELFQLSRDEKKVFVSFQEGSAVQEIGVEDKLIEREIRTSADPGAIAGSSDGKTLYVTSEISDWVHVVDPRLSAVTDNIAVGTRPRRLLLMPGGKELWVTNELSGQVSIIDRVTNHVTGHLDFQPPGSRPMDVTPEALTATRDAQTTFVTLGQANHVAVVDSAARKIQQYVPVGGDARGIALSADEKTLYVVNRLSDDVSVIDAPNRKVINVIPVGHAPYSVQVDD